MDDASKVRTYFDVEFTGRGGEYFRIWIVNVLLTIVTLGIYSAWAKVRTKQYFYGNAYLDGSSFEYTADPVKILKGRLLAFGLLVAYQGVGYFYPKLNGIAFLTLALLAPAIIVLAIRFRMRYTCWRGIHFNFDADYKGAYLLFAPVLIYFAVTAFMPFYFEFDPQQLENQQEGEGLPSNFMPYMTALGIALFVAMLLFPWWQKMYYQFIGNRTRFGSAKFHFMAAAAEFYALYIAAFGVLLGSALGLGIVIAIVMGIAGESGRAVAGLMGFLLIIPYVLSAAYIQTTRTNVVYGNLGLGDICFVSELTVKKMFSLYITNTLAILLTLGLAIPWAQVRMARYRAETLRLYSYGFDDFSALLAEQKAAHGEEISDLFGWDVGL